MQKYDLHSVAFPTLSEAEMASLGSCPLTVLKKYKAGEKLFRVGDCDCSFFVVKSGQIEVIDESGDTSHVIAVFAAGDVRSGSLQRVGSAAGEGAMAVQLVHECMMEM